VLLVLLALISHMQGILVSWFWYVGVKKVMWGSASTSEKEKARHTTQGGAFNWFTQFGLVKGLDTC
jgi:hypothetical protein